MMVIAILAMLCGAEDFADMEDFGPAKQGWPGTFLHLPHGIPSHDTFGRLFAAIDPEQFEACFVAWMRAVAGEIHGVLARDGKKIRRGFDTAAGKAAVHMVSAWGSDNRVVFGQLAVEEKSNEVTAIPRLLEMLAIKGLIVTIDAMGCRKEIARKIVQRGGDYVLTVKGNQQGPSEGVAETFRWARARNFDGRPEARRVGTDREGPRMDRDQPGHGAVETLAAARRRGVARPHAHRPGRVPKDHQRSSQHRGTARDLQRADQRCEGNRPCLPSPLGRRERPALVPGCELPRGRQPGAAGPRGGKPLPAPKDHAQHAQTRQAQETQRQGQETIGGVGPRLPP